MLVSTMAAGTITVPGTLPHEDRKPAQETPRSIVKPYILDDASAFEYKRLDLMSKILDPWTRGYLTMVGVAEGWHCLELGGAMAASPSGSQQRLVRQEASRRSTSTRCSLN